MLEYASLEDHTLDDLRDLGYPYSADAPRPIHTPEWLVHRQTGKLFDAIRIEKRSNGTYQVGIDESIASHAKFVIFGTERMVSRNFIIAALNDLREDIRDILESEE